MDLNILLFKKFKAAGERQGWWNSDGIVTALSGGGDSVALLWLLKKFYKGRIVAAHLDHCTREGVSHEDAEFSKNLCRDWEIKCSVKVVDVHAERIGGESFEMAGRRERYRHFAETAAREGLHFISVGHSADDLVETQLMNLFRGSGLTGLRGIPEVRENIVRPIIDFRRTELREMLRANGVSWREDASNTDTIYARNRVREELIPWIRKNLNPNFEVSMLGLAHQIDAELAERAVMSSAQIASRLLVIAPAEAAWNVRELYLVSDLVLAEMLRLQGERLGLPTLSRPRTMNLISLIRRGGSWRFQWAADIEVCYSQRGMGWLHRDDIEKSIKKNRQNNQKELIPWWAI